MKRNILRVLLFLLAGAIINIAVAWGCVTRSLRDNPYCLASYPQPRASAAEEKWLSRFDQQFAHLEPGLWRILADSNDWGSSRREYVRLAHNLDATPQGGSGPGGTFYTSWVGIKRSGWPTKAMQSFDLFRYPNDDRLYFDAIVVNSSTIAGRTMHYPLALGLLWPGFAINTIFYGAVLWLLFAAPFALRTRLRSRRGQCTSCGYSLRGSALHSEKCPECGAGITQEQ